MEELFQMASWAQLRIHQKPIGVLNVNGFYDGFLSFLDHAVEQNFMTNKARQIFISASTATELIDKLQVFEPDITIYPIGWWNKDSGNKDSGNTNIGKKDRGKKPRLDLTLRL